ncbi:MAG TPA: SRPBCC domain-containing protein [Flavipsychrobacter sp.]|nr:SRPBCC domain-containing protein [Chitinophagales bacterium]HLO70275.1 SRPBCC domain-containing protein [Flavipsychrobacter sp.]
MEQKTKIHAEDGRQELTVTRIFELPVDLLFQAYTDAAIVAEWMGTKVLKLENKAHGGYQFETTDPKGNIHRFNGVIHEIVPNEKITRTFQMEGTPFPVQLEFLEFESIDADNSKLTMHIVYKSGEWRDKMLQMPFAFGINMAHNRLQEIVDELR